MDRAKATLITIIVLLCIFTPCAVIGTVRHISNNTKPASVGEENVNKNFYFNGSLYFYLDGNLLGTYACSNCTVANPIIDDTEYHTKYYKDGISILQPVLNNMFAIFTEGDKISLYSLAIGKVNNTYEAIKTYRVPEKNGLILVKSSGLWGVFNPNDVVAGITANYEYLAYSGDVVDGMIDMSKLIAKFGDSWKIIDSKDETLVESKDEIVDFNDEYYVTFSNNEYHIFDYKNTEYLQGIVKKDINIIDNNILVLVDSTLSIYKTPVGEPTKSYNLSGTITDIYYRQNDNKYDVVSGENVLISIELDSNI